MATRAQQFAQFKSEQMTVTASWDSQVAGRTPALVQAAMTAISQELLERARSRAPERSGRLISNSGVVMNSAGTEWRIQFHQPYARRQHFGHPTGGRWRGMGGRSAPRAGWGIMARSLIPSRRFWLMNTIREGMEDLDREIAARISRASALI